MPSGTAGLGALVALGVALDRLLARRNEAQDRRARWASEGTGGADPRGEDGEEEALGGGDEGDDDDDEEEEEEEADEGPLVVAVDCGTESLRVGLFRVSDGRLLASHSTGYRTLKPHSGWAEQVPSEWWNALKTSTNAAIGKLSGRHQRRARRRERQRLGQKPRDPAQPAPRRQQPHSPRRVSERPHRPSEAQRAEGFDAARREIRERIKALSIVATTCTLVPVGDFERGASDRGGFIGSLSNALLWSDVRAVKEADEIKQLDGEIVRRYTPLGVSAEWLLPKAMWLKRNRPSIYNECHSLLEMHDYLCLCLTRKRIASANTAIQRGFYDSRPRREGPVDSGSRWPGALFDRLGMNDLKPKLAKVINVGDKVGTITPRVAVELGLRSDDGSASLSEAKMKAQGDSDGVDAKKTTNGVEVICGGGDAFVGALGMGVVSSGQLGLMTGSSNVLVGFVKGADVEGEEHKPQRRRLHQRGVFGPFPGCVLPNLELLEAGQPSTGSMMQWLRELLGGVSFTELDRKAAQISIGCKGLMILDCFQGSRTPYVDSKARGVMIGLTLATTPAMIYRAMLEAIAYGTRSALEGIEYGLADADHKERFVKELVVVGGATRSEFFMQLYADVLGYRSTHVTNLPMQETSRLLFGCCPVLSLNLRCKLVTLTSPDAAMLSAAVVASAGCGLSGLSLSRTAEKFVKRGRCYLPDAKAHSSYTTIFKHYVQMHPKLKSLMHRMISDNK